MIGLIKLFAVYISSISYHSLGVKTLNNSVTGVEIA